MDSKHILKHEKNKQMKLNFINQLDIRPNILNQKDNLYYNIEENKKCLESCVT